MGTPYFFGYGSLVNRATHSYPDAQQATLTGWRRAWVCSRHRDDLVYLTAVPDADAQIDGLIAAVPSADWQALDAREAGYARHLTGVKEPGPVSVYAVEPSDMVTPQSHAILLSYLDVVVQGFLHVYGEAGVHRFFETTTGWHIPIRNDRAAPIYPRAQRLTAKETALVDDMLTAQVQQSV
ncbi:MAG: gamma-glutamylcyclotransferase family protein [Pseudomonadota bacterium]